MQIQSLYKKFITCIVAALCLMAILFNVFNTGAGFPWYPPVLSFYISIILLLGSVTWPVIWHYKQKKNKINSQNQFDIFYNIIRYTLAFSISFFGWAKLLELQFRVPESISSQPMNQQSGQWLTWYFFGYSYGFNLILASVQIVGATLLLVRKTVLFGAVILFAFMSNVALINIFYEMSFGALMFSIVTTIGITYLILLDYKRLVAFFFKSNTNQPSLSKGLYIIKGIFWFSAIVLPLLFVLYLKFTLKSL